MANGTVVEQLLVELDARTVKLDAALKDASAKAEVWRQKTEAALGGVSSAAGEAGAAAEGMSAHHARAARTMASAAEMAARAGKLTGESAKQMVSEGAMMATSFGPQGMIVGAVGVGLLAIVQLFTRARDEARKTREDVEKEFLRIAAIPTAAAAAKEVGTLSRGDPTQRPFTETDKQYKDWLKSLDPAALAKAFGLEGLDQRLTALRAKLTQMKTETGVGSQVSASGGLMTGVDPNAALIPTEKEIAELEQQRLLTVQARQKAIQQTLTLTKTEYDAAKVGWEADQRSAAAKKDANDAEKTAAAIADNRAKRVSEEVALRDQIAEAVKATTDALEGVARDPLLDKLNTLIGSDITVAQAEVLVPLRDRLALQVKSREEAKKIADELGREKEVQDAINESNKSALDFLDKERTNAAKVVAEDKTKREQVLKDAQAQAYQINQAVQGALQLGAAFGVVDAKTASILQNISQIATGIDPLVQAIQAGSTGDIIGASLSVAGGLSSLIGSLFGGGETPEEKAAREAAIAAARKAADALEVLAMRAGDLANTMASGAQITGARGVVGAFGVHFGAIDPNTGASRVDPLGKQEIGDFELTALQQQLHAIGMSFKDLQDLAQSLGLTLSDMPTFQEIVNLNTALNEADMHAFVDTFAGQLQQFGMALDIFGVTDAKDKFANFLTLLTDPTVGAPAIFDALDGLDLASAEGIARAKQIIQDIFTRATSGELTAEDLGGLNLQEFLSALSQLMGYVNDAGTAIGVAATAIDTLNAALKDIDQSAQILGTSAPDVLRAKVTAYAAVFPQLAGILDGLDLSKTADLDTLRERLRTIFTEISSGAAELPDGTSMDDFISAILALMGAADNAASGITSAADTINAAVSSLETAFQILGTAPADQAQQLADIYGLGDLGDLTTQAGKDAAIAMLRNLYEANKNDPLMVQGILAVINALKGVTFDSSGSSVVPSGASSGASGGSSSVSSAGTLSATAVQFDRALDFARRTAQYAAFLPLIYQALAGGGGGRPPGAPPSPPPGDNVLGGNNLNLGSLLAPPPSMEFPVPSRYTGVSAAGRSTTATPAPAITMPVTVRGQFIINVSSAVPNPQQTGAAIGVSAVDAFTREMNESAHLQLVRSAIAAGNIKVG